jgi:hypothetical protein
LSNNYWAKAFLFARRVLDWIRSVFLIKSKNLSCKFKEWSDYFPNILWY